MAGCLLIAAVLAAAASGAPAGEPPVLQLSGRVLPDNGGVSTGGRFVLERLTPAEPLARGGRYELLSLGGPGSGQDQGAGTCLCGSLFADGFESGDTSAWSTATSRPKQ